MKHLDAFMISSARTAGAIAGISGVVLVASLLGFDAPDGNLIAVFFAAFIGAMIGSGIWNK